MADDDIRPAHRHSLDPPNLADSVLALAEPLFSWVWVRGMRAVDDILSFAMLAWNIEILLTKDPLVAGRMLLTFENVTKGKEQEHLCRAMFASMRKTKRRSFPDDDRVVARMFRTWTGKDTFRLQVQAGIPSEYT